MPPERNQVDSGAGQLPRSQNERLQPLVPRVTWPRFQRRIKHRRLSERMTDVKPNY